MVLALLAMLPTIFSAISSATELFDVGKKVVEEVTGVVSPAATPDELRSEVESMTPEQQSKFVDKMSLEIEAYKVVSERLAQQGGQIDADTLNVIPEKERAKVAVMRMTTRPWAVRWMVYAVVLPPLLAFFTNFVVAIHNMISTAYSTAEFPVVLDFLDLTDLLNDPYLALVGWAAGVIMTYMGAREVGKAVGNKDGVSVSDITGSVSGALSAFKKVFK